MSLAHNGVIIDALVLYGFIKKMRGGLYSPLWMYAIVFLCSINTTT